MANGVIITKERCLDTLENVTTHSWRPLLQQASEKEVKTSVLRGAGRMYCPRQVRATLRNHYRFLLSPLQSKNLWLQFPLLKNYPYCIIVMSHKLRFHYDLYPLRSFVITVTTFSFFRHLLNKNM